MNIYKFIENPFIISSVVDGDTKMTLPANQITAYVGVSSKSDPNKANRAYTGSRVFVHPDYNPDIGAHADVALLQLSKPIQFVDGIKNGCIDYSESIKSYYIITGRATFPFKSCVEVCDY